MNREKKELILPVIFLITGAVGLYGGRIFEDSAFAIAGAVLFCVGFGISYEWFTRPLEKNEVTLDE